MDNKVYQWENTKLAEATFLNKVYGVMSGGLLLTGLTARYVADNVALQTLGSIMIPCIILELVMVFVLSALAKKTSALPALICFVVYSILNGITLSSVFWVYQLGSVMQIFFTTALTFGVMSLYGVSTKRDLTSFGNLCIMGLIGIIIAGFVNFFVRSSALEFWCSCLGVLIFVGLTAYDTQKIKQLNDAGVTHNGIAIIAALSLYLDFINLFLHLLQLFGKRRD